MSDPTPNLPTSTTSNAAASPGPAIKKPRISLALATAFGLGYLPKAPGTFGSLAGVALAALIYLRFLRYNGIDIYLHDFFVMIPAQGIIILLATLISAIGVLVASQTASYLGKKDPQIVVIDEVSGQIIAYFGIGAAAPNWKYLLLGFILFRVFDIWKPFPARQAESLPGGLGIMADDWIAGIYAALGLWAARAMGL
jgi:phosphatidylglycerophosphatase A